MKITRLLFWVCFAAFLLAMVVLVALAILGGVDAYYNGSIRNFPVLVKIGMIFTALAVPLVLLFGLHKWLLFCDTRRMALLYGQPLEPLVATGAAMLIPRKESADKAVASNVPGAHEIQERHHRLELSEA